MDIALLVPTYNEAENIEDLFSEIYLVCQKHSDISIRLFIIDGFSPDGTSGIVKKLKNKFQRTNLKIILLQRPSKESLAQAYIHGFMHVRANYPKVKYILQMDADLSHDPGYIYKLLNTAVKNKLDLTIGSRYIKGGNMPDWNLYRRTLSRFGNIYARIFLGKRIRDYTGGFNLYLADILKDINFNDFKSEGYAFQIELKYRVMLKTHRVKEIPIRFKDRSKGTSKLPRSTLFKALVQVPSIKMIKK
jgi:dolichol-phosphate mannosyltransferase